MATKSKSKKTSTETNVEQHEGVLKRKKRASPGQGAKKRKSRAKSAILERAIGKLDMPLPRKGRAKRDLVTDALMGASEPEVAPPTIVPSGRKRAAKKAAATEGEKPATSSSIVRSIFEADPEAKFSVIVAAAVEQGVNANTARGVLVRIKQAALYKGA